ncbi:hypothetical protein D3C73_1578530 [compost metagenome]
MSAIATDLFKIQDSRKAVLPVGIVVLFLSVMSAENYPEHLIEGRVSIMIVLILAAFIPLLLFLVHLIRRRFALYRQ